MSQQRDLDVIKRDRFELLSAYLDGEVSPEERHLVMNWLSEDPQAQCLYQRLLHLRQGFQHMRQTSWSPESGEKAAVAVIHKLNYRFRLTCMAGATAAAAAVIGVFSGALNYPMGRPGVIQTRAPIPEEAGLEIALDQPPITIPRPDASEQSVPNNNDWSVYDGPESRGSEL